MSLPFYATWAVVVINVVHLVATLLVDGVVLHVVQGLCVLALIGILVGQWRRRGTGVQPT